jgi:hypothetical protein
LENMLDPSETKRTVVSVVGGTKADNVALDLLYARDVEEKASVAQVNGTLDVAGVSFKAEYALMDAIWGTNNRTPYAEKQKLAEEKSHSKPIQANQNRLLGRVEAPLFGFKVYGQASKYVTSISDGEFDRSLEVGVSDLNIGGFLKVNALKENGLNQFSQVRDRIFGQAVLDLGVDLSISYHKQISDQLAATEHTQNHYMLKVADSIELSGVPINYALAFGSSISNSKSHTKFELGVNSFKLTPVVEVSAKYALTNNVLTKNEWLPNANWTDEDLVERSLGANWALNQKMTVTGNLAMADSNVNGLKVTRDAGFNYKLEAFGGDLTLGYGYRLVTVDGIVDGTARNTVSASFAKSVNGFVLKANGRYVSGGTAAEAGNDNDTTGSIELTYPVLDNAVFTLQGNYVKSEGDKLGRPEYNGHSLTAGLKVTF